MYKNASQASQGRLDRKTQVGRSNENGIDPTSFGGDADKQRLILVREKIDIEAKISASRRRIDDAYRRKNGYCAGSPIPTHTFNKWQADHKLLISRMASIQGQLMDLKLVKSDRIYEEERDREKRFERVFMKLAKELLAGPVYDRIVHATIHRMGEVSHDDDSR